MNKPFKIMKNGNRVFRIYSPPIRTRGISKHGKSTDIVECPICARETEVYIWSFSGNGKLCVCGAKMGVYGTRMEVTNE